MPTPKSTTTTTPVTLWLWPSGMYPRRLIYYLKAKHLPSSTQSTLTIIPVHINKSTGTLTSANDLEERPPGTSLPVLRIGTSPSAQFIYQSSAILEYFELIFPQLPSLSGSDTNPFHRAHINQLVQHINESLVWTNLYLQHSNPLTLSWSGMTAADQNPAVAARALAAWKRSIAKLESWVREDVVDKGTRGIAGGDGPSLADFSILSASEYLMEMYGWDVFEGFEVMQLWVERARGAEWYVSKEEVDGMDTEGVSSLFVD